MGAEGDHAGGEEVETRADLVPAEEQDGEEAGLEEEREDALGGERAAEDVADVARVGGPVGAKLKFEDEAGGDAEREGEGKDLRPEARHLVVNGVLRAQPESFDDDQQQPEPDTEGRVEIVKRRRERELEA